VRPALSDAHVAVLTACLELPLAPGEMALLRSIVHHAGMGTLHDWGMANFMRQDEVNALFNRCQELLRVP
jgi:hypothetical protein